APPSDAPAPADATTPSPSDDAESDASPDSGEKPDAPAADVESTSTHEGEPIPDESDASKSSQAEEDREDEPIEGPVVVDRVLPCGLRVVAARDDSLPVASVVLAIETGTRNDPKDLPGLIHALAFQLWSGNRELRPGQPLADIQDYGGLGGMAVGFAQVRYQSLVPYAELERVLDVESERLRAPNTNARLWTKALSYARNDARLQTQTPLATMAAAWDDPSLGEDGRGTSKALADLVEGALAAKLAQYFEYSRATLVVVAPEDPRALLEKIEFRFADLPVHARSVDALPPFPALATGGPREVPWQAPSTATPARARKAALAETGQRLVWPVRPTLSARALADATCRAINRLPVARGARRMVTCNLHHDPRRPTFALQGASDDPVARISEALARVRDGDGVQVVMRERAYLGRRLALDTSDPLSLAIELAQAYYE
ncbi:MAG TPA: hypothetical protein VK116_00045, partial [Planctomycetota bacterium]|nr:hypothetical protein [Planctomycetota bacterium]